MIVADSSGTRKAEPVLKASIKEFGAVSSGRTIFAEDWWLDAAAPGAWDRVIANWDGDRVGEMTFHLTRRWGLRYLGMPHLTRTMSPRITPPPSKAATRHMLIQSIVAELVAKLPRHDRFERALEPGCPSIQGFVHQNFAVTHMFTFRSDPGDCPDTMLRDAHHEVRRAITKARRECAIETTQDLDRFTRLHKSAYGKSSLVDYDTLERLFGAASARGQAKILVARLDGSKDTAAMVLLWDQSSVYTWLLARDGGRSHGGASSLLSFEAMRMASSMGRVLDLDGYVTPAVGSFLTKFGLRPVVRPYVNGSNRLWQTLRCATTIFRPERIDRHYRVG